jgi:hypothetical protein
MNTRYICIGTVIFKQTDQQNIVNNLLIINEPMYNRKRKEFFWINLLYV